MPRENSDELDSYINDLAGIEPDVNDNGNNEADAGDDDNTPGQQLQPQQKDVPNDDQQLPGDQNTQQQQQPKEPEGKDKNKQSDQQQQQPKKLGRPLGDGTFVDGNGNITDAQGNVIAQGGFASRMYQTNQRLKARLEEQTTQLNDISRQVGEVQSLAQSISRAGLSNDETAQAINLASRMKRGDYLGVAKEVLALVAAQGYNVTELLGSDVGDTIEMRAIQQMIDTRLAPITRQEQARQQESAAEQNARANYSRFIQDNEYADVHADAIARLAKQEGVNPQTAYNRLYRFAAENGMDFSQPLGPQIQLIQQANARRQQQRDNVKPAARGQRPMPNGGATRGNGAVSTLPEAGANDDWGSIIREVQRTLGNA